MTTASAPMSMPSATRSRYLGIAVAAAVLHGLMMIPGYNEDGSFQTGEFVVMLAISLAVSIAVFLLVVPRGGAVTALVLAVVALLSILVFWAMLTLPLAAAGAVTAWQARERDDRAALATTALIIAVLAAVAVVAVTIGDAASS